MSCADAEDVKYRPRRSQRKESLLVPRLLWFTVYLSLCFMAYKGMKYFSESLAMISHSSKWDMSI